MNLLVIGLESGMTPMFLTGEVIGNSNVFWEGESFPLTCGVLVIDGNLAKTNLGVDRFSI